MTDQELLIIFRRSQVLLAELIRLSPLCEAEVIKWGQPKGYCNLLVKVMDELTEIRLNPGKDIQHLVLVGLITQQEKVDYTRDYNKNKNNMKKIYNLHPKGGGPERGNNGNNGNGNNDQGGGQP